jgi:hypothetical protein
MPTEPPCLSPPPPPHTLKQILFPESYIRTAAWLQEQAAANAATLAGCQAALRAAVEAQPRFAQLAGGVEVKGRAKTLFSTLKKLLRLGNTAAGGRARAQLHDLIGLRAVVLPRGDLPAEEAEALAAEACYLVRDAALRLWQPVAGRCKDYVAAPKPNGYQSLHSTLRVAPEAGAPGSHAATLELQIRTQGGLLPLLLWPPGSRPWAAGAQPRLCLLSRCCQWRAQPAVLALAGGLMLCCDVSVPHRRPPSPLQPWTTGRSAVRQPTPPTRAAWTRRRRSS